MSAETGIFFLLSGLTLYGALASVLYKNLVVAALHLAFSLLAVAGLFFLSGAWFLAGVQVIVYAGAVMVLFVMVLMLFDSEAPPSPQKIFLPLWVLKTSVLLFFTGLLTGFFSLSLHLFPPGLLGTLKAYSVKDMARLLFSEYVLLFEVTGFLLLLIAIGVVVVCQSVFAGGKGQE